MTYLIRSLLLIAGLVFTGYTFAQLPFPEMIGKNLNDEEAVLPQDFSSRYTLVLMPLQQNHEATFRTWEEYLKTFANNNTEFDFYQVLPLGDLNFFLKGIIGGALKGAYDDTVKPRTMPLFAESEPIFEALSIADDSEMHVLLVQNQMVIWRTTGEWSQDKAVQLEQLLN